MPVRASGWAVPWRPLHENGIYRAMKTTLADAVLRRLLVVKKLLASIPTLTPTSDAVAAAIAILTAHDAAELALATAADVVGVPRRRERMYLMDYAAAIRDHLKTPVQGYDFLARLNEERISFKHKASLPNVEQWRSVGDEARGYVEQWCQEYLQTSLADLDLAVLIENAQARALYVDAKRRCDGHDYQGALELLGQALYLVLRALPGAYAVVGGGEHVSNALRVAAFGVNAGQFLTLQELLPSVSPKSGGQGFEVTWNIRKTGHAANWTEENVRFCLDTFVDVAIKVQHAPWSPWPVNFHFAYVNTATARRDGAALWREPDLWNRALGRQREPVKEFRKGDVLRGLLVPVADPRAQPGIAALAPSFEEAAAYFFHSESGDLMGGIFVDDFEIGFEPRDSETTRRYFPHLFTASS